jgi:hypothetical protein
LTFNPQTAKGFIERMFDPTLGLCRAAPNAEPNTVWIFNDNYLASYLLRGTQIGNRIASTIQLYLLPAPRIVAVTGTISNMVQRPNMIVTLKQIGDVIIKTEQPGPGQLSFEDYADIAFLYIINLCNRRLHEAAVELFTEAETRFWDGQGFKDKSWTGLYQLYKNALYLIAAKRLSLYLQPKHADQCRTRIAESQTSTRPEQLGGCLTEYSATGPTGDTNVESTVLCHIAMS